MNIPYLALMAVGVLICGALLQLRLHQRKMRWLPVLPSVLLGAALAKISYVVLQWHYAFPRWEWSAFWIFQEDTFCFVGGAVGAVLGIALSARLTKQPILKVLDAFAPAGALMAAVARFGEKYLGLIGTASDEMPEALSFFPFALTNEWDESYPAIFMLSCLAALAAAVIGFCAKKEKCSGGLFFRTAFYLALPQIMLESFLAECMKWGFVRVQQVLCAVILLFVLIAECRRCAQMSFWKKWRPIGILLLCVIGLVGVEFALDKSNLSAFVCYGMMLLLLCGIAAAECTTYKRIAAS